MLLKTRIIVFVLLAVASVVALALTAGQLRERDLERDIVELKLGTLEQAWNHVVEETAERLAQQMLGRLALQPDLIAAIREGDRQALGRLAPGGFAGTDVIRIDVFGTHARLLWSSDDATDPTPMVGSVRLQTVAGSRTRMGGARLLGAEHLGLVGVLAVADPDGDRAVGWLAAAAPLADALGRLGETTQSRILAINASGHPVFGEAASILARVDLTSVGHQGAVKIIKDGARYREILLLPIPDLMGGRLFTLLSVRDVTRSVTERKLIDRALIGAIGLALMLIVMFLYLFLRRNFEILDDAVAALHDLSRGQRGHYVELPKGSDEIGRLAVAVDAFGQAVDEVARTAANRERRQRRQQRFIRRQMEGLSATLEDEAREELLSELKDIEGLARESEAAETRAAGDELGLIALGFSRLASKVGQQQTQLSRLVRELREALEDKRKLISLQQELEIAARMQLSILPRSFPKLSMLDMTASMHPAKEVGGDFYDVFEVREGVLGVVVADVSGKGIPAAFFMLISRTMLRTVAVDANGPGDTLARLNTLLAQENEQMMFVTVFYAEIELATGLVTYSNGGHNPPYLVRAGGVVEVVPGTAGVVLASFADLHYGQSTFRLSTGDTLFMFTDGVTEAFAVDGTMYGDERLQMALALGGAPASSEEALRWVLADLKAFTQDAEQSDDITAITVHWRG